MKRGPKPFRIKTCKGCGLSKRRSSFYKKGHLVSRLCKVCTLADNRKRAARYVGKYRAYQYAWRLKRYRESVTYRKRISRQKKAAYKRRKDAINKARRERWATDPHDPARLHNLRREVKIHTPRWVDRKAILAIYANCPKRREVDHIIPIKGLIDGRPVSGLHVPWNLQYLTPVQNRTKNNRISEKDIIR